MGRHSGAVCTACEQRVLVREGLFIEHWHEFPGLGTSVPCVGSHSHPAGEVPTTDPRSGEGGAPVGAADPAQP